MQANPDFECTLKILQSLSLHSATLLKPHFGEAKRTTKQQSQTMKTTSVHVRKLIHKLIENNFFETISSPHPSLNILLSIPVATFKVQET